MGMTDEVTSTEIDSNHRRRRGKNGTTHSEEWSTNSSRYTTTPLKGVTVGDIMGSGSKGRVPRKRLAETPEHAPIQHHQQEAMNRGTKKILENLWAKKTWERKRSMLKQYQEFHKGLEGEFPEEVYEKTTLWLQWMAASRWGDATADSQSIRLIPIYNREFAVLFGPTIATRKEGAKEDHQVIVRRNPNLPKFIRVPLDGPLRRWTTDKMDRWLRAQGPVTMDERQDTMCTEYTTHSVIRGALQCLVTRAAKIPNFPVHLIPMQAKSKQRMEIIPQVTMRYPTGIDARVVLARALRTQEATSVVNPL